MPMNGLGTSYHISHMHAPVLYPGVCVLCVSLRLYITPIPSFPPAYLAHQQHAHLNGVAKILQGRVSWLIAHARPQVAASMQLFAVDYPPWTICHLIVFGPQSPRALQSLSGRSASGDSQRPLGENFHGIWCSGLDSVVCDGLGDALLGVGEPRTSGPNSRCRLCCVICMRRARAGTEAASNASPKPRMSTDPGANVRIFVTFDRT
mmetsp:Transcript_12282/g.31404  ORF Transcript_12282/g.31404 Transcript_12282/m.31404 type:complete len:206 (-) Transcript_12282:317-934(-)